MNPAQASARTWKRWPLARQLPFFTAVIVLVMMTLMLTLTYQAMVQSRLEAMHSRLSTLMSALASSSDGASRARGVVFERLRNAPELQRALSQADKGISPANDSAVLEALEAFRQPADTALPIELLTLSGQRIANVGTYLPGDTTQSLAPELHARSGTEVTRVPPGGTDSVLNGALYSVRGKTVFWVLVAVKEKGKRVGYVAEQRRILGSPQTQRLINGLVGSEARIYLGNLRDSFQANLDGSLASAPVRRDTTDSGFVAYRESMEPQIGIEAIVGQQFRIAIEVPRSTILLEPRATLRRILLVSLLVLVGGLTAVWIFARRITRPLGELTVAAEAIAEGDYQRRVEQSEAGSNEVERLSASFNRMAAQVEVSQREFASQVDEAERANQAKSDFLAVMSHELRTPLNAISGYTDILKMGIYGGVNEQQSDALTRIARSTQTLLALINDVLNFAKLEAGEVSYSITDVNLMSALAALEDLVSPQLRDKGMRYTVRPCSSDLTVRADAEKLQQIMINLLSNAIKYTDAGGSVEIHCDVDRSKVRVNVTDSGVGIASDRIERIFDPFIQVGRALNRPHEGVGLGLSISRDLARAMGGSLSVRSAPGKGSTFTLTLDRA